MCDLMFLQGTFKIISVLMIHVPVHRSRCTPLSYITQGSKYLNSNLFEKKIYMYQ